MRKVWYDATPETSRWMTIVRYTVELRFAPEIPSAEALTVTLPVPLMLVVLADE